MIGLDTGFFVALLGGHPEAVRAWKALIEAGVTVLYTTDAHMEACRRKGVEVVNLKNR